MKKNVISSKLPGDPCFRKDSPGNFPTELIQKNIRVNGKHVGIKILTCGEWPVQNVNSVL